MYPLAAETEEELKDWMDAFSKILGVDEIPSQTGECPTGVGWGGEHIICNQCAPIVWLFSGHQHLEQK